MVTILKIFGLLCFAGSFYIFAIAPSGQKLEFFIVSMIAFAVFGWMSDSLEYLKEINKNIRRMAQIAEEEWQAEEADPLLEGAPKTKKRHPFFSK